MALFGHTAMSDLSPLSGVERKTSAPDEYFAFWPIPDIGVLVPPKLHSFHNAPTASWPLIASASVLYRETNNMMNVRGSLRASTVVVALALAPGSMAQAPTASPPSTVDTSIGQLKYEAGFPTKETVSKLYNEMDFQRAVMAYQYAEPLVALNEVNVGIKKIGISEGDMAVVQRFLDPNGVALTGNNTTIYGWSFLDLAKGGPLVVETPEGAYGAFFDLWQRPVAEIGPEGADKGKGGKFLVLPSDYAGTVPAGYFPLKISTTLGFLFVRGIVKNGDVEAAAKPIEETRIYPLAKQDNPTKTKVVLASGKKWYSISPEGFEYWERVADIVNRYPPIRTAYSCYRS
jgi:hypothetical protein